MYASNWECQLDMLQHLYMRQKPFLCCRGTSGVAWAGPASSHCIYSVGADAEACQLDALTGQIQRRFSAGKHALTCIKVSSGAVNHICFAQLVLAC